MEKESLDLFGDAGQFTATVDRYLDNVFVEIPNLTFNEIFGALHFLAVDE